MDNLAQIKANLQKAIEVMESTPEENIDLSTYRNRCGTLHCTAGWLGSHPFFRDQGFALALVGAPKGNSLWMMVDTTRPDVVKTMEEGKIPYSIGVDWMKRLFGPNAFDNLFAEYGGGTFDPEILGEEHFNSENELLWDAEPDMSHKQLALARLRKQLDDVNLL